MSISLRVSLGYWLFGVLYIIFSDTAMGAGDSILELSLLKGCLFITISAVLLYFLLTRYLKRSESYRNELDTVVNRTSDLLWMVDVKHRFVLANKTLCLTLGVKSSSELLQRPTVELTTEEAYTAIWKPRYDLAFNGETVTFLHVADPPGDNRQFEFTLYPVRAKDGTIDRVVCFGHDVSAFKQIQRELESQNAALTDIARMQSHEVRKPLANIMGLITAIDADIVDNPELKKILVHIKNQSIELDGIIRKIVAQTLAGSSDYTADENSDFGGEK